MRPQIFNAQVVWNLEISLRKRRNKTYLLRRSSKKIFSSSLNDKLELWTNWNFEQGTINIPLAHDNKDLYKPIMHPGTGVCVDIKLVPLKFLKLSCSTCHKNLV